MLNWNSQNGKFTFNSVDELKDILSYAKAYLEIQKLGILEELDVCSTLSDLATNIELTDSEIKHNQSYYNHSLNNYISQMTFITKLFNDLNPIGHQLPLELLLEYEALFLDHSMLTQIRLRQSR